MYNKNATLWLKGVWGRPNLFIWNKDTQAYGVWVFEKTIFIWNLYYKYSKVSVQTFHNSDTIRNKTLTLPVLVCISLGKPTTNLLNFFTYEIEEEG